LTSVKVRQVRIERGYLNHGALARPVGGFARDDRRTEPDLKPCA
jgi:hypothetical protein